MLILLSPPVPRDKWDTENDGLSSHSDIRQLITLWCKASHQGDTCLPWEERWALWGVQRAGCYVVGEDLPIQGPAEGWRLQLEVRTHLLGESQRGLDLHNPWGGFTCRGMYVHTYTSTSRHTILSPNYLLILITVLTWQIKPSGHSSPLTV